MQLFYDRAVLLYSQDFDISHKYGPHSGLCHQERVIHAFENHQLVPLSTLNTKQKSEALETKMCVECGNQGHFRSTCTSMFE